MKKEYTYFYFMKQKPDKIQLIIPEHVSYWKNENVQGYSGGPFADRSGGLIAFQADTFNEAELIVRKDPFIIEDVLDQHWLKEWIRK